MEEMYNSKTAAMNLVHELCKLRPRGNLDTFMELCVGVMNEFQARRGCSETSAHDLQESLQGMPNHGVCTVCVHCCVCTNCVHCCVCSGYSHYLTDLSVGAFIISDLWHWLPWPRSSTLD